MLLVIMNTNFGVSDRLFCEQPFKPMMTKVLPLLAYVFACTRDEHVRPVSHFLVLSQSRMPMRVIDPNLGLCDRLFLSSHSS